MRVCAWCRCVLVLKNLCVFVFVDGTQTRISTALHHNYCGGGVLGVVVDEEDPLVVLER